MRSHDLLPDLTPPTGGLAKLMRRIEQSEVAAQESGSLPSLYRSLLVAGFAAAVAIVVLPRSSPTLSDLIARSDALHLYKYGLKEMPATSILLQNANGAVPLRPTAYGYRTDDGSADAGGGR